MSTGENIMRRADYAPPNRRVKRDERGRDS